MGIIIEFKKIGNAVKVTALDEETLTEVSISGPTSASQRELEQTAVKKLEYVMSKEANRQEREAKSKGRGIIV